MTYNALVHVKDVLNDADADLELGKPSSPQCRSRANGDVASALVDLQAEP